MASAFQPLSRESTGARVSAEIRQAILTGRLTTGARLTETALATQFQVSRAVIREALRQLGHEGLIELNSFRGARVVDLSPEQVDQIVSLRLLLEAEAVRLAFPRMTAGDKQELRRLAGSLAHARHHVELFTQLDLQFHTALWKLSGNPTLQKHLTLLVAPLFAMGGIMRHARLPSGGEINYAWGDHAPLAEAISNGTVEEAVEAIRQHITENWAHTRAAVEKFREARRAGRES